MFYDPMPPFFASDFESPCGVSRVRVTRAWDADEHAQNLSKWDQSYDQLSPGPFEGRVMELWLPKTQIFVESANRQLHQTCAAWPDSVWFGIPAAHDGKMLINGKPLAERAICIRDGGREIDLETAPDFDLFGVVVDRLAFADYLDKVEHQDLERLLRQGEVLNLSLGEKRRLCLTFSNLLNDTGAWSVDQLQDRIFSVLANVLTVGESDRSHEYRTYLQRCEVVNRVRNYLLENPDTPPSILDLCRQLHISRRSLQTCFEEITGMAPLAYMRAFRLNQARRELKYGDQRQLVSSVAYAWGFNHLSQFAQDYRRLFGEAPSAARKAA